MSAILPVSIGIGLFVSLFFSEFFGLAAGGMVVPGYIALYLTKPFHVFLTLAAGFVTFAIIRLVSSVTIVYGKRRTTLMILTGYLLGVLINSFNSTIHEVVPGVDLSVIGYIIPGLIAIWIDRQGIVETIATLVTAAVVVRLILILVYGTEISLV